MLKSILEPLPEVLDSNALLREDRDPSRTAVVWLGEDGRGEEIISYATLDRMARSVAGALQAKLAGYRGDEAPRVVLLCRPGPGFIAAFLGCLYARAIAVPAYPVDQARRLSRLKTLLEDSEPAIILADSDVAQMAMTHDAQEALPALSRTPVMDIAVGLSAESDNYTIVNVDPEDIAFLQYTSGSTGRPKGVMVTHGNLRANATAYGTAMRSTDEDVIVSWLPLFHDMGLIGTFLHTLFTGCQNVVMPPSAFLIRPAVWWEAVSKYRGTITGAPNFAYALSSRRVPAEIIADLDLSSLRVLCNAAEPVRADTMAAFAEAFAPAGFRSKAFFPCYGLAEATLFASGGPCGSGARSIVVERAALGRGHVVLMNENAQGGHTLVSCGAPALEMEIQILDPNSGRACAADEVGEICLSGPSVSQGYWKKPDVNAHIFADGVLRTGDLGTLVRGELYVTGRLKDTIIIAGRNHYPQDIEATVEALDASVRPGCVVAYGTDGESPQVGIVAEIQRQSGDEAYARMARAIAGAVGAAHGVPVAHITLIPARSLSKTTSGKLQRNLTREHAEGGKLDALYVWRAGVESNMPADPERHTPAKIERSGNVSPVRIPPKRPKGGGVRNGEVIAPPPCTRKNLVGDKAPLPPRRVPPRRPVNNGNGVAKFAVAQPSALIVSREPVAELRQLEDILQTLIGWYARSANIAPERVTPEAPLTELGLDSLTATELSVNIEERYNVVLKPAVMWECPNLRAVAEYVARSM